MARKSLAELQARFKKQQDQKTQNYSGNVYPFWMMQIGQECVVRILPDLDENNPDVITYNKLEHTLTIDGEDTKIPCPTMYGEDCPICELSRKYYTAKDEKMGVKYYRKKVGLVRLLVLKDALPPTEEGETFVGKTCNTQFGFQLLEVIQSEILGGDLEAEPWNYDEGYNFIIKKTKQGEYGTYAVASGFARKQTAIPEEIREGIELVDLKSLRPQPFGADKVQRMLDSHLTGKPYIEDGDDGNGEKDDSTTSSTPQEPSTPAPVVDDAPGVDDAPVVEQKESASMESSVSDADDDDDDDDDIFKEIRARQKAKKKAA